MTTPRVLSLICLSVALGVLSGTSAPPESSPPAPVFSLPPPASDLFYQDISWSPESGLIAASEYSGPKEFDPKKWSIVVLPADGTSKRTLIENAMWVSWAPDGKRLAFASERDGNWEIYAAKRDGSDILRITNDPAKDSQPAWSPKNTRIAFSSNRDGKHRNIYTMSPDGSGIRRITNADADDHNPSWSPNGARVVFYRERGDNKDQVFIVEADGTGERCISSAEFHNTFPSFLPDGRVAHHRVKPDKSKSMVVVDAATGEGSPFGPQEARFARWSPDRRRVAFIAGSWPRSAIYIMRADGAGVKKIAN